MNKEIEKQKLLIMISTIKNRCQQDIFVPRKLCTLQGKEIDNLLKFLENYKTILDKIINKNRKA